MLGKVEKRTYIIALIVLLIGILCLWYGFVMWQSQSTNSMIKTKEDVESYLSIYFKNDEFEISNKEIIKVNSNVEGKTGYSWTVKSKKTGITFNVYDAVVACVPNIKCSFGVSNNYEEELRNALDKDNNLKRGNYYDSYDIDVKNYNNYEEVSNVIFEIINKYNLKYNNDNINLMIINGDESKIIDYSIINNTQDIIDNYLNVKKE